MLLAALVFRDLDWRTYRYPDDFQEASIFLVVQRTMRAESRRRALLDSMQEICQETRRQWRYYLLPLGATFSDLRDYEDLYPCFQTLFTTEPDWARAKELLLFGATTPQEWDRGLVLYWRNGRLEGICPLDVLSLSAAYQAQEAEQPYPWELCRIREDLLRRPRTALRLVPMWHRRPRLVLLQALTGFALLYRGDAASAAYLFAGLRERAPALARFVLRRAINELHDWALRDGEVEPLLQFLETMGNQSEEGFWKNFWAAMRGETTFCSEEPDTPEGAAFLSVFCFREVNVPPIVARWLGDEQSPRIHERYLTALRFFLRMRYLSSLFLGQRLDSADYLLLSVYERVTFGRRRAVEWVYRCMEEGRPSLVARLCGVLIDRGQLDRLRRDGLIGIVNVWFLTRGQVPPSLQSLLTPLPASQ